MSCAGSPHQTMSEKCTEGGTHWLQEGQNYTLVYHLGTNKEGLRKPIDEQGRYAHNAYVCDKHLQDATVQETPDGIAGVVFGVSHWENISPRGYLSEEEVRTHLPGAFAIIQAHVERETFQRTVIKPLHERMDTTVERAGYRMQLEQRHDRLTPYLRATLEPIEGREQDMGIVSQLLKEEPWIQEVIPREK